MDGTRVTCKPNNVASFVSLGAKEYKDEVKDTALLRRTTSANLDKKMRILVRSRTWM